MSQSPHLALFLNYSAPCLLLQPPVSVPGSNSVRYHRTVFLNSTVAWFYTLTVSGWYPCWNKMALSPVFEAWICETKRREARSAEWRLFHSQIPPGIALASGTNLDESKVSFIRLRDQLLTAHVVPQILYLSPSIRILLQVSDKPRLQYHGHLLHTPGEQ